MRPDDLTRLARDRALEVLGFCETRPDDGLGSGTLALLGPGEPGFWAHVRRSREFLDGGPDPLDRWSDRVIGDLATTVGALALFPFGDPPRPFIGWALRSERAWVSPVGLLVHDVAGLLVSYRGALLFESFPVPPQAGTRPCETCETRPCLSACPVGALGTDGYNLAACHGYLDTPDGSACMTEGCAVRRACPISQAYPRDPEQSAFHMAAFHPTSAD